MKIIIAESECYSYINAKLENKIIINEDLLKYEIKKGKQYIILKTRAKESILNQLINMKDEKDENKCTPFNYEVINGKTKEKKLQLYL